MLVFVEIPHIVIVFMDVVYLIDDDGLPSASSNDSDYSPNENPSLSQFRDFPFVPFHVLGSDSPFTHFQLLEPCY